MKKVFIRSSVTYLIETDSEEEYTVKEFQEDGMSAPELTVTDSEGFYVEPSCEVYSEIFNLFYNH